MRSGEYRVRTALREILPEAIAPRIPKGTNDCGNHEWYKSDERTWRCYHCKPGVTHEVPWDARELAALRREAEAALLRAGLRDPEPIPHH